MLLVCSALAAAATPAGREPVPVPAPSLGPEATVEAVVGEPLPSGVGDRPTVAVVFLHGWNDDASAWQRLEGPRRLAEAAADSTRFRYLAVAPTGGTSSWLDWRDGSAKWESFLAVDLSAWLAREYGTVGVVFVGTSMGGEAALRLFFRRPSEIACAAAHSAAIQPLDPADLPEWARQGFAQSRELRAQWGAPIDADFWAKNNVLRLAGAAALPKAGGVARVYFDVGRDDHLGFDRGNVALSARLAELKFPHTFALRPGGHGDEFTSRHLGKSLSAIVDCVEAVD